MSVVIIPKWLAWLLAGLAFLVYAYCVRLVLCALRDARLHKARRKIAQTESKRDTYGRGNVTVKQESQQRGKAHSRENADGHTNHNFPHGGILARLKRRVQRNGNVTMLTAA